MKRYGKIVNKEVGDIMGMKKVRLELSGLSCGGCIGVVKATLENAGAKVKKITLNEAEIEIEGDIEKYIKAIKEVGYDAMLE